MQAGAHGGAPLQFEKAACREYHVLYVFIFPMITIMWMQAGAHGGTPLQFEKAAYREYHVLYVFMSNKICLYV